jgi:hypothetical protein
VTALAALPAKIVFILDQDNESVLGVSLTDPLLLNDGRISPIHLPALAGGQEVVHMLHG